MTDTNAIIDAEDKLMSAVRSSLNDLPITARLEFAANLVFDNGGMKHNLERVPALVVAHEVITDVIKVLEKHPAVAQLRTPEP